MSQQQYLRKWSLTVTGASSTVDLSPLRITFQTKQADKTTPSYVNIRVFNLSDSTSQLIQNEGETVELQAGYQDGNYGIIFSGQVIQIKRGRANQTDTYLDIMAGDGDFGLNQTVFNQSLKSGWTDKDVLSAAQVALKANGITNGPDAEMSSTSRPRGKVLYGMVRDTLRDTCANQAMTYSVQNGQLTLIPLLGFLPGEAVVCNSQTGMIGLPEQTQNGIKVRMLLNPQLSIGSKLQINQASIQLLTQPAGIQESADFTSGHTPPGVAKGDGTYRIYVIEYKGDTRGNDWYSDITCLSIDPTLAGITPELTIARGLPPPGG
jgi:hypothetical protein